MLKELDKKIISVLKTEIVPKGQTLQNSEPLRPRFSKKAIVILILIVFGVLIAGYYGNDISQRISKDARLAYQAIAEKIPLLPYWQDEKKLIADNQLEKADEPYSPMTSQEEAVINVVKRASASVLSIAITKEVSVGGLNITPLPLDEDLPFDFKWETQENGSGQTQKQKVGGGTGFIVSGDGLFITNRHVVEDDKAEYSVITSDGREYGFKVLDKDPFQDLAICQIEKKDASENFPILKLGDSDAIEIGQTVVAIGNALGQFNNSVSVGVVSGLGRNIVAEGGGISESLEDIIQTDAAINRGNSGGPLLNLKGEVVGVNSAVAQDAQSIGFAILVNKVKRDIESLQKNGKIVYPFLGVRYFLITKDLQIQKKYPVDYGAVVGVGTTDTESAVVKGEAADKAGIKEGDIILEAGGQKVTQQNSLSKIVQSKNPGDKITLKVLRDKKELTLEATLGEMNSSKK